MSGIRTGCGRWPYKPWKPMSKVWRMMMRWSNCAAATLDQGACLRMAAGLAQADEWHHELLRLAEGQRPVSIAVRRARQQRWWQHIAGFVGTHLQWHGWDSPQLIALDSLCAGPAQELESALHRRHIVEPLSPLILRTLRFQPRAAFDRHNPHSRQVERAPCFPPTPQSLVPPQRF